MEIDFEGTANLDDWPPNVKGKPTQAAVFGVYHSTRGKVFEILWSGKFPDLEPAMYWAAKKEIEAVRKRKWMMASRVLWQHELTVEQAVEATRRTMQPQLDASIRQIESGVEPDDFELAPGPIRAVDHSKVQGHYIEITDANNPDADPLASFITDAPIDPANDIPITWTQPKPRTD